MSRSTSTEDGRNIGAALGRLSAEASVMEVSTPDEAWPLSSAKRRLPVERPAQAQGVLETYYDLPVIKAPPWKWYIPAYFYVGGVAGAMAIISSATTLSGRRDLHTLERRTRWIGASGDALSGALLIADLGRPGRFLNMLRVFRPTSPMNLGTWILTASGLTNGAAAVLAEVRGPLGRVGRVMGAGAGMLGLPLCTYTAVLLSNTAVPIWARAHRTLPVLFGASALASAASLLELTGSGGFQARRIVSRLAIAGKASELVAMHAVEHEAGDALQRRPLRRGRSGKLWLAAKVLGACSLAASTWPGGSRRRRWWAGALGTAGALAMRFAMLEAGKASAADPRATFVPQRARADARRSEASPRPARTETREPAPEAPARGARPHS